MCRSKSCFINSTESTYTQPMLEQENNIRIPAIQEGRTNIQHSLEFTEQSTADTIHCTANTPISADKDDKVTLTATSRLVERIRTAGDSKLLSLTPRLGGPHEEMVSLDDDEGGEKTAEADTGTSLCGRPCNSMLSVRRTITHQQCCGFFNF